MTTRESKGAVRAGTVAVLAATALFRAGPASADESPDPAVPEAFTFSPEAPADPTQPTIVDTVMVTATCGHPGTLEVHVRRLNDWGAEATLLESALDSHGTASIAVSTSGLDGTYGVLAVCRPEAPGQPEAIPATVEQAATASEEDATWLAAARLYVLGPTDPFVPTVDYHRVDDVMDAPYVFANGRSCRPIGAGDAVLKLRWSIDPSLVDEVEITEDWPDIDQGRPLEDVGPVEALDAHCVERHERYEVALPTISNVPDGLLSAVDGGQSTVETDGGAPIVKVEHLSPVVRGKQIVSTRGLYRPIRSSALASSGAASRAMAGGGIGLIVLGDACRRLAIRRRVHIRESR